MLFPIKNIYGNFNPLEKWGKKWHGFSAYLISLYPAGLRKLNV
jgi:hypothetical protein